MTEMLTLPGQFAVLERFIPLWAKSTVNERVDARCSLTMPEIREFYDITIERASEMLEYLEQFPLHEMPEDAARLMQLLMSLVQASVAVEIQGQPLPPKTDYPFPVKLVSGVAPYG